MAEPDDLTESDQRIDIRTKTPGVFTASGFLWYDTRERRFGHGHPVTGSCRLFLLVMDSG